MSESGVLLPSVRRLLESAGAGATLDEVAVSLLLPALRVRSALREARSAGMVRGELDVYRLTKKGAEALLRSGVAAPLEVARD
jgi:hypothetical protein